MSESKKRTRVIVERVEGNGYEWRAPICEGRHSAQVELRGIRGCATPESAKAAGERHVKRLFPGIVLE